jgi:hypothetical protein
VSLGVPEGSLESFPETFRRGMAARSEALGDTGPNGPQHWDAPFGTDQIHIQLSIFSDDLTGESPPAGRLPGFRVGRGLNPLTSARTRDSALGHATLSPRPVPDVVKPHPVRGTYTW